jgi:hypothetical protein
MTDFETRTAALERSAREHPGIAGLVLVGSASGLARRDEWSDHDFFMIAEPGREEEVRDVAGWLPEPDRVALIAREGAIGFAVVYDDGHVFEFAASTASELDGALVNEHRIAYDEGPVATLVAESLARAAALPPFDAANDARLVLVKLLIGVGRARRGERVNAAGFLRGWAVNHLVRAVRARIPLESSVGDSIDPTRRFERDYPDLGGRIADALDLPAEACARELFDILRGTLEPGWDDFPTRAADAVAARLGWDGSR